MGKKIFSLLVAMVCSGFIMAGLASDVESVETTHQHSVKDVYLCPMHPKVTSDRKGSCPICGMDLVKKKPVLEERTAAVVEPREPKVLFYRNPMDPAVTSPVPTKDSMGMDYIPVYEQGSPESKGIYIDTGKQQMIGLKKSIVQKRPLAIDIATVGKVAYDPDLYIAQEEYIQAVKMASATEKSALAAIREQSAGLLVSAEMKLLLLGMSKSEIEALKDSGFAHDNLYFPGHSGKAWIYMTIYEYELGLVKEGQEVFIDAVAFPGEVYKGKIMALTPVLNAESRTVRVRAAVEDKEGKLRPEMFVNANIMVELGEKLAVPEEAVMDSGLRKIVYVVKDNSFILREVMLGPKAGEFYEVISGLNEGEEIVTSGNFLIDAESRLKGAL